MNQLEAWNVINEWLARNREDFARLGNTGETLFVEANDDTHATAKTVIELAEQLKGELEGTTKKNDGSGPECCGIPMTVTSVSFKGISYRCDKCGSTQRFDDSDDEGDEN